MFLVRRERRVSTAFIISLVVFGYTILYAKPVPELAEDYTFFRCEVIRGIGTPVKEFFGIGEREIALVVAVAFLIIGNEDILVATEFLLGFEGFADELVKGKGEIDSIHILRGFLVTLHYMQKPCQKTWARPVLTQRGQTLLSTPYQRNQSKCLP
jgi:hypothetical protein